MISNLRRTIFLALTLALVVAWLVDYVYNRVLSFPQVSTLLSELSKDPAGFFGHLWQRLTEHFH